MNSIPFIVEPVNGHIAHNPVTPTSDTPTNPYERIAALEQQLHATILENARLHHELQWRDELDSVKSKTLSASQKATLRVVVKELAGRTEWVPLKAHELCSQAGQSKDTFLDNLEYCTKELRLFQKRRNRIEYKKRDGSIGYRSELIIQAEERIIYPRLYRCTEKERNHGGERPQCEQCHSENLDIYRFKHCRDCGHNEFTPLSVKQTPDTLLAGELELMARAEIVKRQVDVSQKNIVDSTLESVESVKRQVDVSEESMLESVETEIRNGNLPPLPTPPLLKRQVDVSQLDYPVTPPPCPFLETFLARRIGHGPIIKATGDVEDVNKKYTTKYAGYLPDMGAYLLGKKNHIYGSHLLLEDGTTWLLAFDFDDKQPELDAAHVAIMATLAAAGIASVYWKRRPGRGHLELYFDSPVLPEAAYAWTTGLCAPLATCLECYPIGEKRNGRISWPFYQRIGDTVTPCSCTVMLPGSAEPIEHPGIIDMADLSRLLALAVTPGSLIPELAVCGDVTQDTRLVVATADRGKGGVLLDIPARIAVPRATDDGLGKRVIAQWNESHTWEEATGQEIRNQRFCATWRDDDKPSVVLNKHGHTATDYGRTGSTRKPVYDRFEVWLLTNGLDKTAEVKRLIAAYVAEPIGSAEPVVVVAAEQPSMGKAQLRNERGSREYCAYCNQKAVGWYGNPITAHCQAHEPKEAIKI